MKYSEFKPQLNETKEYLNDRGKAWLNSNGTLEIIPNHKEHVGWSRQKYQGHKDYPRIRRTWTENSGLRTATPPSS